MRVRCAERSCTADIRWWCVVDRTPAGNVAPRWSETCNIDALGISRDNSTAMTNSERTVWCEVSASAHRFGPVTMMVRCYLLDLPILCSHSHMSCAHVSHSRMHLPTH